MNAWSKKTVKLATTSGYLDQLYHIYPNEETTPPVDTEKLKQIGALLRDRDCPGLLQLLLKMKRFPVKDSYVGFLRQYPDAIHKNPQTVRRLCAKLKKMGLRGLANGLARPKEANTRRGQQFRVWIADEFTRVSVDQIRSSKQGIVVLEDSEKAIRDFCRNDLDFAIKKRPDFVAKAASTYVVGEAKFLSSSGGNQGRGFDDAVSLVNNSSGIARKVALVDGVFWVMPGSQQFKTIENSDGAIFSALLLRNYLKSLTRQY